MDLVMTVLLGIAFGTGTAAYSLFIKLLSTMDLQIEIAKRGYKVSIEDLKTIINKKGLGKFALLKKYAQYFFGFIPVLNVILAIANKYINKNILVNNYLTNEKLIPMTELEYEGFIRLNGNFQRSDFIEYITDKKNEYMELIKIDDEFYAFQNNRYTYLDYERLLPLSYTLDDIKKLNKVAGGSYKVGKMDDVNVAVIGIPAGKEELKDIMLSDDDYSNVYTFENMSEEDARNNRFIIYPFSMKNKDDINRVIDDIKESRNNNIDRKSYKMLKSQYIYNNSCLYNQNKRVMKKVLKK